MQYAPDGNSSPLLPAKTINLVQKIVGTLLYYSNLVDPTMLAALVSIAAQQSKVTEKNYSDTLWLLNYAATHPNTMIRYTTSGMVLHIHNDASYLSKPHACSRTTCSFQWLVLPRSAGRVVGIFGAGYWNLSRTVWRYFGMEMSQVHAA